MTVQKFYSNSPLVCKNLDQIRKKVKLRRREEKKKEKGS
jgi:hypothetical protein